jgi:NADH-quinone oxidoreductase subunit H
MIKGNMFKLIFIFLVAPGFLFTVALGLFLTWVDRKVTARLQFRKGPPWFQPLADILKLLGKETILQEETSPLVFLGAPILGMAALAVAGVIIWQANLAPSQMFLGDLIVVIYLLTMPSLMSIIGASSSRNPLAALGASREMKLILAYELPFIIAAFTVVGRAGSIILSQLIGYQTVHGPVIASFSGALAFIAALFAMQAKLGMVPFDIAEADQEIAGGTTIEYSGPALAVIKLTKAMLYAILPLFMVTLFLGGLNLTSGLDILWSVLKYLLVVVLIILIKNTNPRLRIDQALRLFWGPVTIIATAAFVLALMGW